MSELESIVGYLDAYLGVPGHPDYPGAVNGLQVASPVDRPIRRVAAAVDASEASIADAVARGADLLIVHHGLFWSPDRPITGRRYRKLHHLMTSGLAVYSAHLPLDAHAAVGNCILLAKAMELRPEERFGSFEGIEIGWSASIDPGISAAELAERASRAVGGPARVLGGGPAVVKRVAVVTGGAASFLREASAAGLDALVTGEGPHHSFVDAHELGVHLVLAGHYATETFGVKALAQHVAERFGVDWEFLDHPSGL